MNDAQSYSHFDIQRYLQRKMSPAEMHEFEKALMDDPFLADAIEGFSVSDSVVAERHLTEIENEIRGEKEKAKVVAIPTQKTAWWKVAAIVFVIVTGGVLSYSLFTKHDEVIVADKTPTAKKAVNEPVADSIGPVEKPLAKVDIFLPKDLAASQKVNPPFQSKPIAHENEVDASVTTSEALSGRVPGIAMNKTEENQSLMAMRSAPPMYDSSTAAMTEMRQPALPKQEFKGKVLDESGEPLPFATVKVENSDVGAIADAKGNFTLQVPDTVLQIKVASTGYASTKAEVKSNAALNKIVLKENSSSLSDMVVTTLQSRKEKKTSANATADHLAEPEGGWKKFDQYLRRQVDSLKAETEEVDYDQDVVLEFSIDKQGRPTDITATEAADKKIAEKAKEILSKGPRWKKTNKEKKVKVIIPF